MHRKRRHGTRLPATHAEFPSDDAYELDRSNGLRTGEVIHRVAEDGRRAAAHETIDDIGHVGWMMPVIAPSDETQSAVVYRANQREPAEAARADHGCDPCDCYAQCRSGVRSRLLLRAEFGSPIRRIRV